MHFSIALICPSKLKHIPKRHNRIIDHSRMFQKLWVFKHSNMYLSKLTFRCLFCPCSSCGLVYLHVTIGYNGRERDPIRAFCLLVTSLLGGLFLPLVSSVSLRKNELTSKLIRISFEPSLILFIVSLKP